MFLHRIIATGSEGIVMHAKKQDLYSIINCIDGYDYIVELVNNEKIWKLYNVFNYDDIIISENKLPILNTSNEKENIKSPDLMINGKKIEKIKKNNETNSPEIIQEIQENKKIKIKKKSEDNFEIIKDNIKKIKIKIKKKNEDDFEIIKDNIKKNKIKKKSEDDFEIMKDDVEKINNENISKIMKDNVEKIKKKRGRPPKVKIIAIKLASPRHSSSLCSQTLEKSSMKCEQSERHVVAVGVINNEIKPTNLKKIVVKFKEKKADEKKKKLSDYHIFMSEFISNNNSIPWNERMKAANELWNNKKK